MADNVVLPGTGAVVATDQVTDGVLGAVQVQFMKLMDGTLDSTNKAVVSSAGAVKTDASATTQPVSGTLTLGQTLTDGSTTVSGAAANLFAGVSVVNGYEVVNADASTDLWISDTTTAAANGVGSILVRANGGSYVTPAAMKPGHAVSAITGTTGNSVKITARCW